MLAADHSLLFVQVSAFGNSIAINHAQVQSQNIAIPVPTGFNRFNNRFNNRFG